MTPFSRIFNGQIGDPAPLPVSHILPNGEHRTDLAGELARGDLTLTDLRIWGFYPARIEAPPFNPQTHRLVEQSRQMVNHEAVITYAAELLPPPPPPPPRVVLAGWFKASLSQMGHLAAVNAAVDTLPEWKRILWHSATSIRENDTDVVAIATALNIDLSAVFDLAEQIRDDTRPTE